MRSRNLKPGLFANEMLGSAPATTTILFAGLWCEADREGRLEDRPKRLSAIIFPYRREMTERKVDAALQWLHSRSLITRYTIDKKRYIQVTNFLEHQKPHLKERASIIPALTSIQHLPRSGNVGSAEPELLPGSARLIPDSGFLIPESPPTPPTHGPASEEPPRASEKPPPFDPSTVIGLDPVAWVEWKTYRSRMRKPLKNLDRAAKHMAALGGFGEQRAAVQFSIDQEYQGLFRPSAKGTAAGNGALQAHDGWQRALKHAQSGTYRDGTGSGDELVDQAVRKMGGYQRIGMSDNFGLRALEQRFREVYDP